MTRPGSTRARAPSPPPRQRGAVLVVGLIMLVLITLMVTTAFRMSNTNLKSVGNMQSRNEAVAAANMAIEQVVGSWSLTTPPVADQLNVDIDNNGSTDFVVDVATPTCVRAASSTTAADPGTGCDTDLEGITTCGAAATSVFAVVWDIDATASGGASGSKVRIRQGVSKTLTQAQCDAACPPAAGTPCS